MSTGIGSVIAGRFRIVAKAGEGGMGSVFRAEDLTSQRPVAVKMLRHRGTQETTRFVREAHALASVRHPAVVGYVDHGVTEGGNVFLAMEWIDGEDLGVRLTRGPLPWRDAVGLAMRVADGLTALHDAGLVHRDLKPGNLVLEASDPLRVRIVDLGIARSRDATAGLTQTGAVIGTAGYMSPEQIEGRATVDARADLFALGAVLFECLTGTPAFEGDNVLAVLARFLQREYEALGTLSQQVQSADDSPGSGLIHALGALAPAWITEARADLEALHSTLEKGLEKLARARTFATVLEYLLCRTEVLLGAHDRALSRAMRTLSSGDPSMISIRTWFQSLQIALLVRAGRHAEAQETARAMQKRVSDFAARFPTEEYRATFLALPCNAEALKLASVVLGSQLKS